MSYDEFFHQYNFYERTESERKEFVSDVIMTFIYHSYLTDNIKRILWNKVNTLKTFHYLISRRWLHAGEASYVDFKNLIM